MKNKIIFSVLGAIGLVAVNASAGYHQPSSVLSVQRDSATQIVTVSGSLGDVYNAQSSNVFIECRISGYRDIDLDSGASYEASCTYNDGTLGSNGRQCYVDDNDMSLLQAIVSINGNSKVQFKFDDNALSENYGRCSEITVDNNSKFASKTADVLPEYDTAVSSDAEGALGSARHSANTTEEIGCQLYSESSFKQADCWATASDGSTGFCSTTSRNVVFALGALKSDSLLHFSASSDAEPADCNEQLFVVNSSKYRPAY